MLMCFWYCSIIRHEESRSLTTGASQRASLFPEPLTVSLPYLKIPEVYLKIL